MTITKANSLRDGRRVLRFETIDEVLAEIDRVVEAERNGQLRQLGNWTAGQILGHISAWIDYGYEGYPLRPPPWLVRMFLRLRLKKMLNGSMPAGVRIPGVEQGTVGIDPLETAEAAARVRRSFERLKRGDPAKYDSPAFGPMSHEDRIRLNLRHAELHLSFLNY